MRALADRLDLLTEAIEAVPFSFDTIIYWMGRCAPKLTGKRYFRAHWIWYGALAWSWLLGPRLQCGVPYPNRREVLGAVACRPETAVMSEQSPSGAHRLHQLAAMADCHHYDLPDIVAVPTSANRIVCSAKNNR